MDGDNMKEERENEFRRILQQEITKDDAKKRLDDAGFNINNISKVEYTTAFHLASEYSNLVLVQVLLEIAQDKAADIIMQGDERDKDTAIHMAALGGNKEIMAALMGKVHKHVDDILNNRGRTPLHYALGQGNVEIASYLIEEYKADLKKVDLSGANGLHFAAKGGEQALKLAKDKGMDLNITCNAGLTALHYAACHDKEKAANVKWLLKQGVEFKRDNKQGGLPIHWAAWRGNTEAVKALVKAHADRGLGMFNNMKVSGQETQGTIFLELMDCYHGREHVLAVLDAVKESKGKLLGPKAFPETILVKYVVGYGDREMNLELQRSLEYGMQKKVSYRHNINRLVNPRGADNNNQQNLEPKIALLSWAAEKGNENSIELVMWLVDKFLGNSWDEEKGKEVALGLQTALSQGNIEFAIALMKENQCRDKLNDLIRHIEKEVLIDKFEGKPLAYWIFQQGKQHVYETFFKALDKNRWAKLVNEAGHQGRTALHWAVLSREKEVVVELCKFKELHAHVQDTTPYARTPYEYAWSKSKEMTIELSRQEDVKANLDMVRRERQVFVDALNSILVAAALIVSITYVGFLQPPLGYSYEFKSTTYKYMVITVAGVKAFVICNSLAFFLAIATALIAVRGVLPVSELDIQRVTRKSLLAGSTLLVLSILFVIIAYGAAGFSVLPMALRFSLPMVVTTLIGGSLCLFMLFWFLRGLWKTVHHAVEASSESQEDKSGNVLSYFCKSRSKPGAVHSTEQPAENLQQLEGTSATTIFPYKAGPYNSLYPSLNDGLGEWPKMDERAADLQS